MAYQAFGSVFELTPTIGEDPYVFKVDGTHKNMDERKPEAIKKGFNWRKFAQVVLQVAGVVTAAGLVGSSIACAAAQTPTATPNPCSHYVPGVFEINGYDANHAKLQVNTLNSCGPGFKFDSSPNWLGQMDDAGILVATTGDEKTVAFTSKQVPAEILSEVAEFCIEQPGAGDNGHRYCADYRGAIKTLTAIPEQTPQLTPTADLRCNFPADEQILYGKDPEGFATGLTTDGNTDLPKIIPDKIDDCASIVLGKKPVGVEQIAQNDNLIFIEGSKSIAFIKKGDFPTGDAVCMTETGSDGFPIGNQTCIQTP